MEAFLLPTLFIIFKKSLLAVLVIGFLMASARLADKQSGINFKEVWGKMHEMYKARYLIARLVCFTILFCFIFTIA